MVAGDWALGVHIEAVLPADQVERSAETVSRGVEMRFSGTRSRGDERDE